MPSWVAPAGLLSSPRVRSNTCHARPRVPLALTVPCRLVVAHLWLHTGTGVLRRLAAAAASRACPQVVGPTVRVRDVACTHASWWIVRTWWRLRGRAGCSRPLMVGGIGLSDGHGSLTAVPLGRVSTSTVPVVREMRAIHVGPTGVEHSHGGCRSGYRARAAKALGHGAMTPPVGVPTAHQSQYWCQRPSVECLNVCISHLSDPSHSVPTGWCPYRMW